MDHVLTHSRFGWEIVDWRFCNPGVAKVDAGDRFDLGAQGYVRVEYLRSLPTKPPCAHATFDSSDNQWHWIHGRAVREVRDASELSDRTWYPSIRWNNLYVESVRWPHNFGAGEFLWICIGMGSLPSYRLREQLMSVPGVALGSIDKALLTAPRREWDALASKLDPSTWVQSGTDPFAYGLVNLKDLVMTTGNMPDELARHLAGA